MTKKLTATKKLNRKNARAIAKQKQGEAETNALHEAVRKGEMTAGEALQKKCAKKAKGSKTTQPTPDELVQKFANGDPAVVEQAQAEQIADNQTKAETTTRRKPTLAEAFPPERSSSEKRPPQLIPTGDPTITREVPDPVRPFTGEPIPYKKSKDLRKQQRKGKLLWVTDQTKTIVSVKWIQPKGSFYHRWLVKFSDGTEESTNVLVTVYSREHPDHRLQIGLIGHHDKTSNKNYAQILQAARDDAARRALHYGTAMKNFMSSDAVQKEVESRLTKKAEKESPLTPDQLALAHNLAELANKLECSPGTFMLLPAKLERLGRVPEQFDLSKYGIDETQVTIAVLQKAHQIHRGMEPRIDGVPLSQLDKAGKVTSKVEVNAEAVAEPKSKKEPKPKKEKTAIDSMGSRVDSQAAKINEAVLKYGSKVFTVEKLMKDTGFGRTRVAWHFCVLIERGYLKRKGDNYSLISKKDKSK